MTNTSVYESHLRIEKDISHEQTKANKWLQNLKTEKEITKFDKSSTGKNGCGEITFYFVYKHHELQSNFKVDFTSSRRDRFLSVKDATEEEFKNKISKEKQFRIQAYELELYCGDLLN